MIYCPYSNCISCNRCHVSIATPSYMRRNDRSIIKDKLYPLYKGAFLTDFIFLHGYWVKWHLCVRENVATSNRIYPTFVNFKEVWRRWGGRAGDSKGSQCSREGKRLRWWGICKWDEMTRWVADREPPGWSEPSLAWNVWGGGVVFALFHFSFHSVNGIVFKRLLLECFDFLWRVTRGDGRCETETQNKESWGRRRARRKQELWFTKRVKGSGLSEEAENDSLQSTWHGEMEQEWKTAVTVS